MALKISIHAPPRGATDNKAIWDFTKGISIHAPPRGATRAARTEQPHPLYFNSRPSARGDIPSMNATRRGFLFQFTPLREGRRAKPRRSIGIYFYFNSRPSARGDDAGLCFGVTLLISIHAPPRGATIRDPRFYRSAYFNSRPSARGDRAHVRRARSRRNISIHAPPRGATWLSAGCGQSGDFNSRPSARGDPALDLKPFGSRISIHAPPRGATCQDLFNYSEILFQFTPLREGRRIHIHFL